jgi:lipopolysaccharide/colanic/teichoic acid biosynthesis glycosyltransferase
MKKIKTTLLMCPIIIVCSCILLADDVSRVAVVTAVGERYTATILFLGIMGSLITILRNTYNRYRRFFDVAVSLIALVFSLPIIMIAAILIKLDSPGPILYKQIRVGVNRRKRGNEDEILSSEPADTEQNKRNSDFLGKPFNIYKLRTMRSDAESKTGAVWASKNDNRVTRVGKLLRKTRIDELPQFINVLKGEMSFIGPRPERPEFVRQLNDKINYYHKRFDVKPGITGLAQVRYRYASSVEDTRKKLKYDLIYLKKRCFLLDLNIIARTFETVIFTKGAH